jgi:hypothetical protein
MLLTTALLLAPALAHSAELGRACAAESSFALSKANLGDVLTNLGLRPEKLSETRYRMAIDRGGVKFAITASVSSDGTELWLNTYVAEIADVAKLPAVVMDKLLIGSNEYGPSHFTFVAGEKPGVRSLYLHRALDNHGLSSAAIRDGIDNLASDVVSTQPLWDSTKWPATR